MSAVEVAAHVASFVVPGFGSSIVFVVATARALCNDMKENRRMCIHVLKRLEVVNEELMTIKTLRALEDSKVLPMFAATIRNFVELLEKYARKTSFLKRLTSSRKFVEEMQEFHCEIDMLFKALSIAYIAADSKWKQEWKQEWKQDRIEQLKLLKDITSNRRLVLDELRGGALEVIAELKHEIDMLRSQQARMPDSAVAPELKLMEETLETVVGEARIEVCKNPVSFIRSDDVTYESKGAKSGSFGTVYRAKWEHADVVVKLLLDADDWVQKKFRTETDLWSQFNHPHVIRLYGSCHVSTPMFFVCEKASSNFTDYFHDPVNKKHMWRLFYQAALGLKYLHKNMVVHGDLKCNNLLVGEDGLAKISDFGFSFSRAQSRLSKKAQTNSTRWKALECLEGNPHFESDVYALGMCIIEAVTGRKPWGEKSDDDILDSLEADKSHPRPDTGLTDKQWELVRDMCRIHRKDRLPLVSAIFVLKQLADEEEESG